MPYQPGGMRVVLSQTMTPRVIDTGKDKSGLERWAYTRLQGKDKAIIVIYAYIPFKISASEVQALYEQRTRSLPIQHELQHFKPI